MARILDTASVRIEVDVRRAERDAEHAGEDAGRAYAKGANQETKRNPAKLKLDPMTADFQRVIQSEVARISREANVRIPLTMQGEKMRAQVAVWIGEIERTLSADIPTNPADALEYRRKLAEMVREASNTVRARIPIHVDVDRERNFFVRAASTLGKSFAGAFTNASAGTFSALVGGSSSAFGKLGTVISSMASEAASSFSKMLGPLLMIVKTVFAIQYVVPAVAAGISLLGGSAVAAFGAISAAALGLPVLLFSLGAPIAAIALGMDGIKRAAEPLKDEFQTLKDLINVTFELNMRPVFEKLQAIFPTLNVGLSETARAVSRVAMDLTGVVTSEPGIENLRVAFAGVSDMIDRSREGTTALFTSLLNVAGTRELYDILGETIGGVAFRFGNMIERVRSSGDLTAALVSLRDVLFGVVDMLNVLIEGSIKFFASAGPGLSAFFASLTEVLSRIDWAALGEAFGGMMERLGAAIEAIPPEKWQELADAIGALSEKFIKMVEEGTFVDFIEGIAGVANVLLMLKEAFDGIEAGLNGLVEFLQGDDPNFHDSLLGMFTRAIDDLLAYLGIGSPAQKFIDIGLSIIEGLLAGLAAGPVAVFEKVRELATKALEALGDASTLLVDKGRQFVEGVKSGIGEKLADARAKAVEIKDNVKEALADAKDTLVSVGEALVDGFISGIGSKISHAAQKAAEMARRAYDAAKAVLGISSPSTLFAAIGRNTVDGFLAGLQERIGPMIARIREIFARAAQVARAEMAEPMVQAEDGSWVPASFYTGGVRSSVGAARQTDIDLPALMDALSAVFNSAEWKIDGGDIALVANRGNVRLARR